MEHRATSPTPALARAADRRGGLPGSTKDRGAGLLDVDAATLPPVGAAALAALVAFVAVGVADGLVACGRLPVASRHPSLIVSCALQCVGVSAAVGLVVAVVQELLVRAALRRPSLRALGSWLRAGPSAWFGRDERGALAAASALIGTFAAGVALVAVVDHVTGTYQFRAHMVGPLALAAPLAVCVAAASSLLASWPLAFVLRRAGPFASVGAVVTLAAALALVPAVRVVAANRDALAALDPLAVVLGGALILLDLAALVALLRTSDPVRARNVPRAALAAAFASAALAALPAFGLGRRQVVLAALASRSALVRRAIGPLQRAVDRDGDGHGVLFGGGDCDDRDPRIYPGAPETLGNGIDESCSGRDGPMRHPARPGAVASAERPPAACTPSVLFVSIDAARPDRMSAYGYRRPTTPNLARLAGRSARFTSAYAVAPGSLRSFASTFTGRYPGDVAWGRGVDPRFPAVADENVTLAESLRGAGYATAAFTNTSYFSITPGFFQGFEHVREAAAFKDDAVPVVREAVEWIDRARDRPFFAWVHLIDAHAPYGDHRWPHDFGRAETDRYDAELARADLFAAPLIEAVDALERRGSPVLLVVFSDHGEGFNEHGARYHFYDVHEETIRVPLLVRGPGVVPGDRRGLVALLDLHATVLDLVGLPVLSDAPSRSLAPLLLHGGDAAPPGWREEVYADVAEHGGAAPTSMALVAPPWKIAFDAARGVWELYNLALDPREERNLYDDDPRRAADLRSRLLDVGGGRR